ncbi:hypothetical protein [Paractinoplanes durhamensis]|nr:hypothetical protein [Actinoplanes durhamensis]
MLLVLAIASAIGGIAVLNGSHGEGIAFEVGKWLLQLTTVLVGAGAIATLLRWTDLVRARREAWTGLMHEVIAAGNTIEMAGRTLQADISAASYQRFIETCREVRAVLRRITAAPALHEDEELRNGLNVMRRYLTTLVLECEDRYLAVARQQQLDDYFLEAQLKKLATSAATAPPRLPTELAASMPAAEMLRNAVRFKELTAFRESFDKSPFRIAYVRTVKPLLEKHAGVHRRPRQRGSPSGAVRPPAGW